jgi:hypothetical protein
MMQRHRPTAVLLLALLVLSTSRAADMYEPAWSRATQRSAGPAWLVRGDVGDVRPAGSSDLGLRSSSPSGWSRAGAYGLEFGGAVLGTAAATAIAVGAVIILPDNEDVRTMAAQGMLLVTGVATGPILSATGTHLGGSIAGQRGSYWHTLIGSFAGGIAGTSLACGYESWWTSHHNYSGPAQAIIALSCIVVTPWVGAIIAHNVWR